MWGIRDEKVGEEQEIGIQSLKNENWIRGSIYT